MNEYSFHCPVKGEATLLTHCEEVHSLSTKGRPEKIEDKVCALAHLCWMCPARNAFKVGGIWSKPGAKPRSDKPMETPAKLPPKLVTEALAHTTPLDSDYRRAGMWGREVGKYDDLFKKLQGSVMGAVMAASTSRASTSMKKRNVTAEKADTIEAAILNQSNTEMADTVTELAKRDAANKRATAPASTPSTADTQKPKKPVQRSSEASGDVSKPRLTLAERARLMKERKSA
ncbi:MAG: hypothetical protein LPK02_07515 [Rhodobacterales bacterium]|nr:hypothetical protein [Rhodobacterales bacterium]